MRRLFVILSAVLALVGAAPALTLAQEATPTPAEQAAPASLTRTNTRYLFPYTLDGLNANLTVTATEAGVCNVPSSHALHRPDAWDCISESNIIYDPCFENPFVDPDTAGEVACFDSPFSSEVVVLTLDRPLPREKETDDARPAAGAGSSQDGAADAELNPWDLPWALELANGEQCALSGGTVLVVGGQVANYSCTGGGMVFGRTDRGQPVWVVSYLAEGDYATTLAEVVTAWS